MTDISDNEQITQRKTKLAALRARGGAYPNDFRRDALAQKLHDLYGAQDSEALREQNLTVKLAGRIMTRRLMGKASFVHIQDMSGKIQVYIKQDDLGLEQYEQFLTWDLGDIIGVVGSVFKTKTGELSVKADQVRLLTKALLPMPEKFHGLVDHETRYRQRYLDLMVNPEARKVFTMRSHIITAIRDFLMQQNFLEVETPMMQVIPGGATARPFITHHNTLDLQMYLRISPELYLKRLVVGGMERVFEINRSFRNEGVSIRHNPEFTMLEFYMSYADYRDLMDLTENMLKYTAQQVLGTTVIKQQDAEYDLGKPFIRMSLKESILHFNPDIAAADLDDLERACGVARGLGIGNLENYGLGKVQYEIFEKTVEKQLKEPTFITAYPVEVSPLARRSDQDPFVTDRFEFFIGGKEIGNGFSELNDPEDQAERFLEQVKNFEQGDQEAMHYDADYITALEHGLPPTAGEGIGIDRLVMLFTDSPSIRDVILFPTLRPKC